MDSPQFLENEKRLKMIKFALQSLKETNSYFLSKYELTKEWIRIREGMLNHHIELPLKSLVQLRVCETNSKDDSSYNPFQKHPITLCYNKINNQQKFNKLLTYNLILHYDSKVKKNMNWNQSQLAVITTVRALTISGICQKRDKFCINEQLQKRVFTKERFKGKQISNLQELINKGRDDSSPISGLIMHD